MTRNPHLPLQPATGLIRVGIRGDDETLQEDLSALIARLDDVCLVEDDAAQVILCDVGARGQAAELEVIAELDVPAVALVGSGDHVAPALAAGARGVVARRPVRPEIGAVVSAVVSGLTVVDTTLAHHLHSGPAHSAQPGESRRTGADLTGREIQVAKLLSEGLSNKLIADRLGISDHTAKFHVNGVMTKLNASSRTEAVVEALRRGVIEL